MNEKILNRVKKLLAMAADGSSPNEAAIAAKRARALMDKHQISQKDLVESDGFGEELAGKSRQSVPLWEQGLAIYVAELNDCRVTYESECVGWRKYTKRFKFQGFESDVIIARYMFGILTENGNRLCKKFMKTSPVGGITVTNTFKKNYSRALSERIKKIIKERKEQVVTSTGTSLVVQKTALVTKKFGAARYKKASSTDRSHDSAAHAAAAHAGRQAGKSANITTGVTGKSAERLS